MYKYLIRKFLFCFQPEKAHAITFFWLKLFSKIPLIVWICKKCFSTNNPNLQRELFGIKFPNPVGLAGGLDKDAEVFDMLGYLGFGFVEVGTVTPKPQPGNPKPRLFRLINDKALINRMGFNNKGVDYMVERLKKKKSNVIIAGNIGKNKITPNEQAIYDYQICFEKLFPYVDFFVVNVSSPNTPDLRQLQDKEPLKFILSHLQTLNLQQEKPKPILLKIAPDLNNSQLDDIVEIVNYTKIHGIVATNTTISREGISIQPDEIERIGAGGLSGKPLKNRSTEIIKYLNQKLNGKVPIIGVGGIMNADDAIEKLNAGAALVQLYTGFIYEGVSLIKKINKEIIRRSSTFLKS